MFFFNSIFNKLNLFIALIIAVLFIGFFESVSIFTIGYVGTLYTVTLLIIPNAYINHLNKQVEEKI